MAGQQPAKAVPNPAAAKSTSANDVFSGTVTAYSAESLTVVRKVPARADESRAFIIDPETKTEGAPRVNARVTVSFKADDDGTFHASRIIVRSDAKTSAGTGRSQTPAGRK